ncbi:hypothetical protein [Neptunicella sp. SCSIO 80796]
MNRNAKGFGLYGVFFAVLLLIVSAVFGAKADAAELISLQPQHQSILY